MNPRSWRRNCWTTWWPGGCGEARESGRTRLDEREEGREQCRPHLVVASGTKCGMPYLMTRGAVGIAGKRSHFCVRHGYTLSGIGRGSAGGHEKRASKEFPNVTVCSFSPPYKKEFTNEDNVKMLTLVNKVEPDILFVGMTAPKQEKWVYNNNININAKLICSIGAVFDFYSETVSRPSKFWIKSGLEWLPRFLHEPIRLAKRNLISTPKFILQVLYMLISKKNKS